MAESIYTQLDNGKVITPVDGKDYTHSLPLHLFPSAEQFEDADKLIAWADENDFTAKLIKKGLQKAIIEVRAVFKACKKDATWTEEMGIAQVNKMQWESVDRPNQGGGKAVTAAKLEAGINMARAMKAAGIGLDMILASLTPVYGEAGSKVIMAEIE